MNENTFRRLPPKDFTYKGTVADSESALNAATTFVTSLIISNISANDVSLTLKSNETVPVTQYNTTYSAGDHRSFEYPEGWEFTSGIRAVASAASSIHVQIIGRTKG